MPGAVVAIARKGKLAYYEAFGFLDKTAGTPMPKDAIFPLASLTKVLTAVATLTLVERTDLLLNDPIGKYLPQLRDMKVATATGTEPARRQPTLQDMMSHSAGVTYGGQGSTVLHKRYPASSNAAAAQMSGSRLLDVLGALPLHYQPGTRWEYSFGLDIAGLAVEAITGQRLGDYLQQRVFAPLRMTDTHFAVPASKAARVARPLPIDPETGQAQTARDVTRALQFDCGGGCASGTAMDYLRFAQMLLNRGALDGKRILGRKTVEHMTSDQLASGVDLSTLHNFPVEHVNGYGFGLSVAVRRYPGVAGVFGSPGDFHWSGAQGTTFWVDPGEELAVVFMANTPGPIRRHYRELIKTLVLQAVVD
jgi:CubicO group peptidase (beta-lactamase class C family)